MLAVQSAHSVMGFVTSTWQTDEWRVEAPADEAMMGPNGLFIGPCPKIPSRPGSIHTRTCFCPCELTNADSRSQSALCMVQLL
jgi:hypothetical protein